MMCLYSATNNTHSHEARPSDGRGRGPWTALLYDSINYSYVVYNTGRRTNCSYVLHDSILDSINYSYVVY